MRGNKNDKHFLIKPAICAGLGLFLLLGSCGEEKSQIKKERFPFCLQYSWMPGKNSLDQPGADRILQSGFTHIWILKARDENNRREVIDYFQEKGMKIDFMTYGCELLDRDHSPGMSVYDPAYGMAVKKKVREELGQMPAIEKIEHVYPFLDEPFHRKEFLDYTELTRAEFKKRYGYEMPLSFDQAREEPKKQIDFLNFQTGIFRDGWIITQKAVKEFDPRATVVMTHDSHNEFGGGVNSNSQLAIDDVYHWGGDYADLFVYDLYPYQTFDYRYGEPGVFRKPRISQMHYTIAQMRNMTTAFQKSMGFWVGTYNEAWFTRFRGKERASQFWAEREIAYTAIANGANYIISPSNYHGDNLPADQNHWDEYVKGIQIIQKAGGDILKTTRSKSEVCFIFPRTQYLLLQEEYYNVGLSFELFLRAFGELDILHEDQITDEKLNGYRALVMCDVKLLPEKVARHIVKFVEKGGLVVADCVPQLNEQMKESDTMSRLFGVGHSDTGRICREGQWVPFVNQPVKYSFPPASGVTDSPMLLDSLNASAFGMPVKMKVVSPRNSEIRNGMLQMKMQSGKTALVTRKSGAGTTYLIGFCLQDTYFQACKTDDEESLKSIYGLIHHIFELSGMNPTVYSRNPDIEVGLRSNTGTGYLFVINHESVNPETEIILKNGGKGIKRITDMETDHDVNFNDRDGAVKLTVKTDWGGTRLLKIDFEDGH